MSQTATARKPLLLPCPSCHDDEAAIFLDLSLIGSEDECCLQCQSCGDHLDPAEIRKTLAAWRRWEKTLVWIDAAPTMEE